MSDFDDFTPPSDNRALAQAHVGENEGARTGIVQRELDAATDPKDRAALARELARLPASAAAIGAKPGKATPASDFGDFKPAKDDPLSKENLEADNRMQVLKNLWKGIQDSPGIPGMTPGTHDTLAAVDMVLGLPGMLAGVVGDSIARNAVLADGGTKEESATTGRDVSAKANDINRQGIDLIHKLVGMEGVDTSDSNVSKLMGKISTGIETGGKKVQGMTGGVVTSEDVSSLADGLMAWAGARGLGVQKGALEAKIKEKTTQGSSTPVQDAVQDMTFGMKMPEEVRENFKKSAETAEKNAEEQGPKVGGLPKAEPVTLERAAAIKAKPDFLKTAEDRLAERAWDEQAKVDDGPQKALDAAAKPSFLRAAEDKIWLAKYGKVALASTVGLGAWMALESDDRDTALAAAFLAIGLPEGKPGDPLWYTGSPEPLARTRSLDEQAARPNAEAQKAGPGHYITMDKNLAGTYGGKGGRIYGLAERPFEKPFNLTREGAKYEQLVKETGSRSKANMALRDQGYDAIVFKNQYGQHIANIFHPKEVKDFGPAREPAKDFGELKLQEMGGVDPKLLTVLGAGALGAYLGYQAFDSTSGGVLGAFLGMGIAKRAPALAESLKETPAARQAVMEMRDRLYTLGKQNEARGLDMLKYLKEKLPKDWAEHSKEIYEGLDQKKPMGERAQALHDQVIVPLQNANKAMLRALDSLGINTGEILEDYGFHRVRVGQRPSLADTLARGSYPIQKGLSTASPSALDRTVHSYTTATGETFIGVKEKGGKVALYQEGEVVAKGTLNAKTGELKAGDRVMKQSRASIEDIEKNTSIRYEKEPLLAELDANFRLGQALNNAYFLKTLPELPGFADFGKKVEAGRPLPEGWRRPKDFQLQQYAFEPKMAEVIDDFTGDRASGAEKAIGKINRVMVGSLFWNPLPHILNVLDHAVTEKGLVGGMAKLPQTFAKSVEAYREVSSLGPKYLAYLREGGGLMYPDTLLGDFSGQVLKAIGSKPEVGPVAKAFGYANPAEMVKRLYEASRQTLWKCNDIMMMQAYLAKEAGGMSKADAIKQVEKHIPNYRLPERVLGSRPLQQILASPTFTTFGRYDYGRLASYGNMAKDLLGKDSTIKDRAHALDQLAMLAVMGTIVYPQILDKFAQALTGNPNAEFTRFGASTIPTLLAKVWNGEELAGTALGKMFHLSPMIELLPQVATNRDLHTGGTFAHTPQEAVGKMASHVAPVNMMQQGETGKQSVEQMFWAALGIKSPTDAQVEKRKAYLEKQQAEMERFKQKALEKAGG